MGLGCEGRRNSFWCASLLDGGCPDLYVGCLSPVVGLLRLPFAAAAFPPWVLVFVAVRPIGHMQCSCPSFLVACYVTESFVKFFACVLLVWVYLHLNVIYYKGRNSGFCHTPLQSAWRPPGRLRAWGRSQKIPEFKNLLLCGGSCYCTCSMTDSGPIAIVPEQQGGARFTWGFSCGRRS